MDLALLLVPLALVGAALGRWTRLHPLVIAPLLGLVPGVLGTLAMAAFTTEGGAILLFGGVALIVGGTLAALGAFFGWLRRKHIERIS